jgi:ATP-dependent Lon protease
MAKPNPTLPLRTQAIFPGMIVPITVPRGPSVQALDAHLDHRLDLVVVLQKDAGLENPGPDDLHGVGTACRVLKTLGLPDGSVRALVEGLDRVAIREFQEHERFGWTSVPARFPEKPGDPRRVEAAERRARELAAEVQKANGERPPELDQVLGMQLGAARLCDHLAPQLGLKPEEAQELLAEAAMDARMERLVWFLERAREYGVISQRIARDVQAAMDASQREYFLREQLKAVQKELGEAVTDEIADYEKKIAEAGMPEDVEREARRELDRLRKIHVDAAEYMVARTYLDWLVAMPWRAESEDLTDLHAARGTLDADHHGLDKVKERILEFLAVRQLKADARGPILCFVGPPGVGKTTMGRSIAKALGRKVERVALGGMKDEAEIRGHRRTYIGALPGRIVQALKRAGTKNPVIILDELDKIGADVRGDPASALLEVLDPEQNHAFRDHYLDVPFDLSRVLFVGTANLEDPIPSALHDRLEIISIAGYTEEEKLAIARNHLLPRLREQNGLPEGQLDVPDDTLRTLVRAYTREAGVRALDRELSALHRKTARRMVEGDRAPVRVDEAQLVAWQGPPKYHLELAEKSERPGLAVGLAWTEAGGDILIIEASKMAGPRGLKITGSLGNVMKESCEASMSVVRENAVRLGIDPQVFADHEFHLHMPAGAVPKDGPSAGVTLTTALVSLLTGRRVRHGLAMTGEVTLRGRVLPVGGIKEKVLAARRAGITDVLLPRLNERDLLDIPEALRGQVRTHLVDTIDDVLAFAFDGVAAPKAPAEAALSPT